MHQPRLITTFKKVEPGTDGAVSVLGICCRYDGAAIVGICAYLLGIINNPVLAIILAVVPGTLGCFMDSILGAVFERKDLLTNEHVNLIATITGALIGILLV